MTGGRSRPRSSIRFWLLALLIPGVVTLLVIDGRNDYEALSTVTEQVYDNALLEPAKVLETSVSFDAQGRLRIDPPFYAQVMLESRAGSRKYFRIEALEAPSFGLAGANAQRLSGRTLLGMEGLPRPSALADTEGLPVFYNGMYRNDEVRMVALWRDLHFQGANQQVLVLVGESLDPRLRTLQDAWRKGLFRDGRMLVLMVLLVWLGVELALRPLRELGREIRSRDIDELVTLDSNQVPREVVPLVDAVNYHIERYRRVLSRQAQFLTDASHQLRTPLAIVLTQAQYAKREPDMARVRETLDDIIRQLGRTSRLTEQLLSLAHANRNDNVARERVDLSILAREVVLQYLPLAREQRQDLGWLGMSAAPVWVVGSEAELYEAIANLVDNAIHHAGRRSTITVSVGADHGQAWASVSDNGVGLDVGLRESVFMRFDRGGTARKGLRGSGSGLGLAIALAYAERNRGVIVLEDGEPNAQGGVGLRAVLRLPQARGDDT